MNDDNPFQSLLGTGTVLARPPSTEAQMAQRDELSRPFSTSGFWDQDQQPGHDSGGEGLSVMGKAAMITGAVVSAIGSYYSATAQKDQLKTQALTAEFQASMANHNARQAEKDAQAILAAGRGQVAQLTAQRGQERARKKVSAIARGVSGASVKELLATEDITKQIDAMTINRNAVRAAGQARMQSVNAGNQSLLAGVSAGNLRRSAGTISPYLAFETSAAFSAGRIIPRFRKGRR